MPDVIGIRFKPCGKIYDFDINGINVNPGVWVVVESEMGLSLGLVVRPRHLIEQQKQQLKKVLRIATVEDLEADRNNSSFEEEAKTFCIEKVKKRNLPMKVVGVEATLDRKRLVFYFTAEGRIDFRELVRDLASKFKTRIEMRQIGVRDEIKFIGGIGVCGREVCCKVFLSSFAPVSIRMAKKQELILNPGKLSGICGRLMCCLGYEITDQSAKKDTTYVIPDEDDTTLSSLDITENIPIDSEAHQFDEPTELDKDKEKTSRIKEPQIIGEPRSTTLPCPCTQERSEVKSKEKQGKPYISQREREDKGRPFSRRKKFFEKKKKH